MPTKIKYNNIRVITTFFSQVASEINYVDESERKKKNIENQFLLFNVALTELMMRILDIISNLAAAKFSVGQSRAINPIASI